MLLSYYEAFNDLFLKILVTSPMVVFPVFSLGKLHLLFQACQGCDFSYLFTVAKSSPIPIFRAITFESNSNDDIS
jgi:hypothetical protein